MGLPLFIARRYLFSRKSHAIINIISGISAFTVAIPVMAMVILLSVFNGFDGLIRTMYRNFDPDIEITAATTKFFDSSELDNQAVLSLPQVLEGTYALEENALFEYRDKQHIGIIRGVDDNFSSVVPIDNMIVNGEFIPTGIGGAQTEVALIGQGVAYDLMIGSSTVQPISVYIPRRGKISSVLPTDIYRKRNISLSGIFALDSETDGQYVIAPINFVRDLLDFDTTKVSSFLLKLSDGTDPVRARDQIAGVVGEKFTVRTRLQQKEELYRLMQYEKWGIYFIILMVLVIASFSIIGSLVMVMIDKRKDTETLITLGAGKPLVRKIFTLEGLLISGAGMVAGLILGVLICLLQQHFGWVSMPGSSFLIDSYPVAIKMTDLIGIVISVGAINFLISWLTVLTSVNRIYKDFKK